LEPNVSDNDHPTVSPLPVPPEADQSPEIWADIPGYPGYQVSTLGRVRSRLKSGRGHSLRDEPVNLSLIPTQHGYVKVSIRRGGIPEAVGVHRLVLLAFVGKPKGHLQCRHLNGVKTDNRLGNLCWGTPSQNAKDTVIQKRGGTVPPPIRPVLPPYKKHPAKDEARCWVAGKWVYLGKWGSPEAAKAYERLCAELHVAKPEVIASRKRQDALVSEVISAFLDYAITHYRRPDGDESTELREYVAVLEPLADLYGDVHATEFGPLALQSLRQKLIDRKWCRNRINKQVGRIRRVFKWAAGQEMIPAATYDNLCCVQGLQRGRTDAVESEPVLPVPVADVEKTLPFLNRHQQAIVRLQLVTGMRPGEACRLKWGEIDRTGDIWVWRVVEHKMSHADRTRMIFFGPKAREILEGFVMTGAVIAPDEFLFSPRRAREERYAALRLKRKSKVPPSQQNRKKDNPKRFPLAGYTTSTLAHTIEKAALRAGVTHWHPSQLRHTFATEVRRVHGLEAAQVLLGHARADVTQVYAERDITLAMRVAGEMG
jgi:integrase